MRIYNTLTRKKEDFEPIHPGEVRMYVCGPTVYNHIHIGNARTFVSFDVIRRHLENSGYKVTFVSNLTDVDDKIINRANEEGRSAAEVASEYSDAFISAMDALGVKRPTIRPRATEEIGTMIETIQGLIERDHAYVVDGDVYFSVKSDPHYGKLSGRSVDDMLAGTRIDVDPRKRDPMDFALWKSAKPGEPAWDSPWGKGRPGWHIECSAMSAKHLGQPFDIHGGGVDLVFPHHENEIAQAECCTGENFCNIWMHGGMLNINNAKMSKSEGNFILLKDALEAVGANVLRMLMLQTHYRNPLDYSVERLDEAASSLDRIATTLRNADWEISHASVSGDCSKDATTIREAVSAALAGYGEAMDDDFNTAEALGFVFKLVGDLNAFIAGGVSEGDQSSAAREAANTIIDMMGRFGIDMNAVVSGDSSAIPPAMVDLAREMAGYSGSDPSEAADALLERRALARKERDFALADSIRDSISALGITVEDTPGGARLVL